MEINSNILEAVGLGLVHSLWQGAALLFLVLLGLVSLRNKKAKTRYALVLTGVLTLPILLAGNLYFFWPASPVENLGTSISSEIHYSTNIVSDFQAFAENPQSSSTVLWIKENAPTIALFWMVGMAFFLIKVLGSFLWMKRLLARASPLKNTTINSLTTGVKLVLGINRPLELKSSSWIKSPIILGFIRPTILFPIGLIEGLSTEEVEAILYHELAHLKRNDFVINIIINVLQIVFFYHPAYWWMKSQLDNEREYATDELALKYSEKKLPMIKALAKVQAFSMNQPGLAFAGNSKNQVLKRINIMMNSKQQPNWLSAIFTIALLLVAFGLMSVQETKPKTEKSTEPNTLTEFEVDLDSLQNSENPQTRIDYLEFDIDPQPQDDSIAISKAILEMVNNPNDFIFEFDEQGEVVQITKSGKELKRSELSNYKIAYARLIKLGFALPKGAEEANIEQRQNELRKKEEQLQRKLQEIERNQAENSTRQTLERYKRLDQVEANYQAEIKRLEKILKPGNVLDQMEVQQIEELQSKLKKLEDELLILHSGKIRNQRVEKEALERRLAELNKQLLGNQEYSEIHFPGGTANLKLSEMIFKSYDAISDQKLIVLGEEVLEEENLKDIKDLDIERIESIQVIKGARMEKYVPKRKLRGVERIIRIVYKN